MFGSLASLFASLSTKAIIGGTVAITAAGGGGAIVSHNLMPNYGTGVQQAVVSCKAQETSTQHGIGKCVSAVAQTKGAAERALHAAKGKEAAAAGKAKGQEAAVAGKAHNTQTSSFAPTSSPDGAIPSRAPTH